MLLSSVLSHLKQPSDCPRWGIRWPLDNCISDIVSVLVQLLCLRLSSNATGWTYKGGPTGTSAVPAPTPPSAALQSLQPGDSLLREEWDHLHHNFSYSKHSLRKDVSILQFWVKGHSAMPLSPSLLHAGPGAWKYAVLLPKICVGREVPALDGWIILKIQRNLIISTKPHFLT